MGGTKETKPPPAKPPKPKPEDKPPSVPWEDPVVKLKDTYIIFKEQGHWASPFPMNYQDNFGFLYLICNNNTKKYYIGIKQYKIEGKKRHKNYGKQSNWKVYKGSSTTVKEDMEVMSTDNFSFFCLQEYKTKGGLKYGEANLQHKLDVLVSVNSKGERNFYNNSIEMIRYIPKEYYNVIKER